MPVPLLSSPGASTDTSPFMSDAMSYLGGRLLDTNNVVSMQLVSRYDRRTLARRPLQSRNGRHLVPGPICCVSHLVALLEARTKEIRNILTHLLRLISVALCLGHSLLFSDSCPSLWLSLFYPILFQEIDILSAHGRVQGIDLNENPESRLASTTTREHFNVRWFLGPDNQGTGRMGFLLVHMFFSFLQAWGHISATNSIQMLRKMLHRPCAGQTAQMLAYDETCTCFNGDVFKLLIGRSPDHQLLSAMSVQQQKNSKKPKSSGR